MVYEYESYLRHRGAKRAFAVNWITGGDDGDEYIIPEGRRVAIFRDA